MTNSEDHVHNVNVSALDQTIDQARRDPSVVVQQVAFDGEWNGGDGPQFRTMISVPNGEPVTLEADFPPPMGGTGSAPNPLVYCFWGGLACYAMTYAQEAARRRVELRVLRARAEARVDQSRALGVTDNAPVEHIDWQLDVEADAPGEELEEIKHVADDHCPGVYCLRSPIDLRTRLNVEDGA